MTMVQYSIFPRRLHFSNLQQDYDVTMNSLEYPLVRSLKLAIACWIDLPGLNLTFFSDIFPHD